VKRYYLATFEPDIVQHLIKQPFSVPQRYAFYRQHLSLPNYDISYDQYNIWYVLKAE
jgi:hypothetical protein